MLTVSAHDREHIEEVIGNVRRYDHWTALFWRLYAKSDRDHRWALRLAAPEHVRIYEEWMRAPREAPA